MGKLRWRHSPPADKAEEFGGILSIRVGLSVFDFLTDISLSLSPSRSHSSSFLSETSALMAPLDFARHVKTLKTLGRD